MQEGRYRGGKDEDGRVGEVRTAVVEALEEVADGLLDAIDVVGWAIEVLTVTKLTVDEQKGIEGGLKSHPSKMLTRLLSTKSLISP